MAEPSATEEKSRKRKRLNAVLDKLTSQVQERRPLEVPGEVGSGGPEVGEDSSPGTSSYYGPPRSSLSSATTTDSLDDGSSERSLLLTPSGGESETTTSPLQARPESDEELASAPPVTVAEVFRFDSLDRERYACRVISEEEEMVEDVFALSVGRGRAGPGAIPPPPPSDHRTPPIVESLRGLGMRSPRIRRTSESSRSPPYPSLLPGTVPLLGKGSLTPPPSEASLELTGSRRTSPFFEVPRLKGSKVAHSGKECERAHMPSVPFSLCPCPSCSILASRTKAGLEHQYQQAQQQRHHPLWLEAAAASEQFLAGGVPMSPVSPLTPNTPASPINQTFLEHFFHTKYLPDLYRRRCHSDGDLQQWVESAEHGLGAAVLAAVTTATGITPLTSQHLPTTATSYSCSSSSSSSSTRIGGNGKPIPKPLYIPSLHKGGSLESDQSTPQDSPLDLSVRTSTSSSSPSALSLSRIRDVVTLRGRSSERRSSSIGSSESGSAGTPGSSMSSSTEPSPLPRSTSKGLPGTIVATTTTAFEMPLLPKSEHLQTLFGPLPAGSEGEHGHPFRPLEVSPVVEEMPPGVDVAYVCPICGQMFSLHDRLAKHMASRHKSRSLAEAAVASGTSGLGSTSPNKSYLCDVCKRSFARSDMLTRHMRLHTGVKPYTCCICGQVFSRSDHLSTHQRTHTGEKPYRCPQCPYAACRRDMITRHMRTHARYELPEGGPGSAAGPEAQPPSSEISRGGLTASQSLLPSSGSLQGPNESSSSGPITGSGGRQKTKKVTTIGALPSESSHHRHQRHHHHHHQRRRAMDT